MILFDGRYPLFYSMPAAAGSRWRRARVHLFNQTCGKGEPDAICRAASRIQMLTAEVSGGGFGHDDWRLAAVGHDGALWLFDGGAANRSWPRERRGTHPNPALRRHTKPLPFVRIGWPEGTLYIMQPWGGPGSPLSAVEADRFADDRNHQRLHQPPEVRRLHVNHLVVIACVERDVFLGGQAAVQVYREAV